MSKKVNALHQRALRAVYWVTYNNAMGDASGAEFSMQRLSAAVGAMRELGEDVSVEDYLNA